MDEFLAELRRTHDLRAVPPSVQSFLLDYLKHERVRRVGDRWVINSHVPPFPGDAFTASRLVELLETGQIAEGIPDTAFRNEGSGLQHTESGRYSVFYFAGMDVTDSVSIISKDGVLIYANLNSCSDSKTYFRSTAEYFRYLHSAN